MKQNKHILSIILTCIALGCLVAAGVIFFKYLKEDIQSEAYSDEYQPVYPEPVIIAGSDLPSQSDEPLSSEDISSETKDSSTEEADLETPPSVEPSAEPEPTPVPNPYAAKYLENEDMAGWLTIPDTVIDYPIMWTPEDEEYYLRRGFDKKKLNAGCLILDTDSCVDPLTTNLIIHGHNMKAGTMFGTLDQYEDEDFYKEHTQIILYTKECRRNYEVIAVFYSQVYRTTDNVFKFYKFFQADTEAEFNDFYDNIKQLSLYDTGVTAGFGDHFITLSTCAYHVENGRFVVVAKEVEPGDTYLSVEESIAILNAQDTSNSTETSEAPQ